MAEGIPERGEGMSIAGTKHSVAGRWRRGRQALTALALLGVVSCSLGTDLRRPENARLTLTGPAQGSLEMIVSTNFLVVDAVVSFVDADTTMVSPPVERTYALGIPARIYFEAENVGDQAEEFALKVWIGGESWYNESKVLAPGESFEFVYRYNEPGIY